MPYFRPIESEAEPNYLDFQNVSHKTVVSPALAVGNHCSSLLTQSDTTLLPVCACSYYIYIVLM